MKCAPLHGAAEVSLSTELGVRAVRFVSGAQSGGTSDRYAPFDRNLAEGMRGQKNAGLKVVTLIATLNPVSQVLW